MKRLLLIVATLGLLAVATPEVRADHRRPACRPYPYRNFCPPTYGNYYYRPYYGGGSYGTYRPYIGPSYPYIGRSYPYITSPYHYGSRFNYYRGGICIGF